MTPAFRPALAALALIAAIGGPAATARAQGLDDETRDRVLIIHQSRGTLAPGTRPKCFPPNVDDTVARSQFQCPWERPNGQPRYPTARSLWGILGGY
jgi:hypothetical protein